MRTSRHLVAGMLFFVWGCANGDDDATTSGGPALAFDGSVFLFDAGAVATPGAGAVTASAAPDAASAPTAFDAGSSSVGVTSGSGSGLPRWDGGFPFSLDGGFPRLDAGAGGSGSDAGPGTTSDASAAGSGDGGDDRFANARQVCIDTINMYRSTLSLPPVKRAAASVEACSDKGAKKDGDSGKAHGSAGSCPGMGAQNTCPGWPVGGFGGSATIEDALKKCLASMWAEGVPAEGTDACISNYFKGDTACFLAHGHYINMASAQNGTVSCGFYDMGGNKFWMNQDLGR